MADKTPEIGKGDMPVPLSGKARESRDAKPQSIKRKLTISLLIVYLLSTMAAAYALYALNRVEAKNKIIESLDAVSQKVLEARRYEKNFLLYDNPEDLSIALDYLNQVRDDVRRLRSIEAFPQEDLPAYEKRLDDYAKALQRLSTKDISKRKRQEEAVHFYGHIFTTYVLEEDKILRAEIIAAAQQARVLSQTIHVLSVILGVFLTIYLIRRIVSPLEFICRAASKITDGELTTIPMMPGTDRSKEEIELVDSLNLMLRFLETKQNQLVQSAKLATIGKVTAGIAHEINNPLNNIYLTAEVLLEDLPNLECGDRLEMVNDILNQADRAREVVQHLLSFSRSRQTSISDIIDLASLIKQTLVFLKNQIRIGQVVVNTEMPEEPIRVNGNTNQLQQVLVNIILNAVQATGPGGLLVIKLDIVAGDTARIQITDNGPGIPDEVRARIFDPFFTTKNDGTGLGLSVSHSIIQDHGGQISVQSEHGKGTTFYITLPVESQEEKE